MSDGEATVVTPSGTVGVKPTATTTTSASKTSVIEDLKPDKSLVTYCDADKAIKGFEPFCAPANLSTWWVDGGDYYVTWDASRFASNASVKLTLNYAVSGQAGNVVKSWDTNTAVGFINVEPVKDWMQNQTALNDGDKQTLTNQTVYFILSTSDSEQQYRGPSVILTTSPKPKAVDTSPSNRPGVSTLGLAIGLPIMVAFIVGMVCCMHFCMRTRRQIGPIAIGGGRRHFRKKGYSGRAARRMKATTGDLGTDYQDEPELGSPGSPGEELESERHDQWELASVKGGRR